MNPRTLKPCNRNSAIVTMSNRDQSQLHGFRVPEECVLDQSYINVQLVNRLRHFLACRFLLFSPSVHLIPVADIHFHCDRSGFRPAPERTINMVLFVDVPCSLNVHREQVSMILEDFREDVDEQVVHFSRCRLGSGESVYKSRPLSLLDISWIDFNLDTNLRTWMPESVKLTQ